MKKTKKQPPSRAKWITAVFLATVGISAAFTLLSSTLLEDSSVYFALAILLFIVLIGIVFDIIGVAVTAAEEQPFHSMAARKVPGARDAVFLLKNADRVASICNDVVGDICGVVSGSASAVLAVRLIERFSFTLPNVMKILMSAMVAGLTVGGKAIGKGVAMKYAVPIVHSAGRVLSLFRRSPKQRKK